MASYLGTPIKTDKLTAVKGKLEYARMLINMKISESVPDQIPVEGPYGILKIPVIYEWKPIMCSRCKKEGHELEQCKKTTNIPIPPNPISTTVQVGTSSVPLLPENFITNVHKVDELVIASVAQHHKSSEQGSSNEKEFTTMKTKTSSNKNPTTIERKKAPVAVLPSVEDVAANANPFAILDVQESMLEGDGAFDPGITPLSINA